MSRTVRSLALQLLFLSIAGGAVAVMSRDPAPEAPVLGAQHAPASAELAKIEGEDPAPTRSAPQPATSPDEPDPSAVRAGQRADLGATPSASPPGDVQSAKEVASPGVDIALGRDFAGKALASQANGAPVTTQPADVVPSSVPADPPPPAVSPSATAPDLASAPALSPVATPSAGPAPANAPPDRAPAAAQGPASRAQGKISTASVRLDDTTGPNGKPQEAHPSRQTEAKPASLASAAPEAPVSAPSRIRSAMQATKNSVLAKRPRPAAIITGTPPQTLAEEAAKLGGGADHAARGGSDAWGAGPVPPGRIPDRVADAGPARGLGASPARPAGPLRPSPVGGSSMWIGLASSSSESDARATLSQLQRQFPGKLGASSIHRIDRGRAGVLYRLRLGPLSLEAASKVCSAVRATGKNCVLTSG